MKKVVTIEPVRIRLLGPPSIERNGAPVKVETRKALALLAYLAVERRSHARASLVALLWPDADESRGRAVLRRTLHALAAALPGGALITEQDQVRLGVDSRLRIDIDEMRAIRERCLDSVERCAECPLPLRAAADLYGADFLAGFTLKDSVAFDDWEFFQTEAFRRAYASILERLVACLSLVEDYDGGIEYASRWLALDNLDEAPHVALMKLHALAGRRSTALRQYETCRSVIRRETGEEPSPRIGRLAANIRSGAFPPLERAETRDLAASDIAASVDRHPATVMALRLSDASARGGDASTRFLSSLYGLVLRYGGRIEQHVGQTVLAVFGRSPTRENAPELAVRAALEARDAARRLDLEVAAGISSGVIAVPWTSDATELVEPLSGPVMGDAKRLAATAPADEILVSESTFRATRRAARFARARAPGEAATAYRLGSLLDEPRKTRGVEGLGSRLVGRDQELAKLCHALERVYGGEPRLVTVAGEAGVGKSRLIAEARCAARPRGEAPLWLEGRCLDIGVAASYWPFIDLLRHLFSWRTEDSESRHLERVERTIGDLAERGALDPARTGSVVRYLMCLLPATDPEGAERDAGTADPESVRIGIFEAVRDLCVALARRAPLVLVFEDLHWADALTLDLIGFLMESVGAPVEGAPSALGLLCAYRPLQDHRCRHLPALASRICPDRYTELLVHDLTPEQGADLIHALLDTRGLPEALTRAILDRSQGNPFYLEEILRSLIDTGGLHRVQGGWRARADGVVDGVPESVESVIRATTDRLPSESRRTLRAASVMGRVFDVAVLKEMIGNEEALEADLRRLEDLDLVYEERTVPRREYSFRHVLTREAVYGGIPQPERRDLHEHAARIIRGLVRDHPEPYFERLAYHYEAAGREKEAAHYLHQAGAKAIRASDNPAAIVLLERALKLVRGWPRGAERESAELEILLTLGVPVTATTGYGSSETRAVYQQALDLCGAQERSADVFNATYGLWRYHLLHTDVSLSLQLAQRLIELGRHLGDDSKRLESQRAYGCTLSHAGRLAEADRVLAEGMAAYDPSRHRSLAFVYGHDPATTIYYYRALGQWLMGFPDEAAATMARLEDLMRDSSHRLSQTYTCSMGAQVFQLRGDVERVLAMSARGMALAEAGHLPMFGAFAEVLHGWALMEQGDPELAAGTIRRGLDRWNAAGGGAWKLYLRSLLAEALRRSGDKAGAAAVLRQTARQLDTEDGERMFESEIYRLQGELRAGEGDREQAEILMRQAIANAEAAGAPSLKLRAVISLARERARHGEARTARRLLQETFALFQEGFQTADLREARKLIQDLR